MGLDLAAAEQLVQEAFDTWSEVDCSASSSTCAGAKTGRPSIRASNAGPVTCGCVEFNGKSGNSNTIVFRDEAWLTCDGETIADREQSQLALTTVTYIPATGEIVDADIEINTAQNLITAGNGRVRNDLASILAHETGHFLGLAHTQPENADATMYTSYVVGKTQMRDLSRDDVCGICSTYPPGRTSACDGTPHRGLSDQCHGGDLADDVVSCGCRVVGSQAPRPGHLAMAGLAALGAAWRARSRRKSERGCG